MVSGPAREITPAKAVDVLSPPEPNPAVSTTEPPEPARLPIVSAVLTARVPPVASRLDAIIIDPG